MRNVFLCMLATFALAVPAGAQVWEWDATFDPTADGSWAIREADVEFDLENHTDLVDGRTVWLASSTLDTRPTYPDFNFTEPTYVDLVWRAGEEGWVGFWIYLNFNHEGTGLGQVDVILTNDGTSQTMTIQSYDTGWNEPLWTPTTLGTITDLPAGLGDENDGFLETSLFYDTDNNTVSVTINGVDYGSYEWHIWDEADLSWALDPDDGHPATLHRQKDTEHYVDYVRIEMPPPVEYITWEWDASFDPTDPDAGLNAVHGTYWVIRGGGEFNTDNLINVGGGGEFDWIWDADNTTLDTRPRNFFTEDTTIDLIWRATDVPGTWENRLWLYSEGWTEEHATVTAQLSTTATGQLLRFETRSGEVTDGHDFVLEKTDYVHTNFEIDTSDNEVKVTIDGEDLGTYSYTGADPPTWGPDDFLTLLGGPLEVAYIRVQTVAPPALEGDVNEDCIVDVADLILVRNALAGDTTVDADVNGDGSVDLSDLVFVRNRQGNVCD